MRREVREPSSRIAPLDDVILLDVCFFDYTETLLISLLDMLSVLQWPRDFPEHI